MAKTARLIRFGLSVSLVLAILVHVVIFSSDNHDADDVSGNGFELTEVVRDREMFRDQQKKIPDKYNHSPLVAKSQHA
jgi:hypothetical protein